MTICAVTVVLSAFPSRTQIDLRSAIPHPTVVVMRLRIGLFLLLLLLSVLLLASNVRADRVVQADPAPQSVPLARP